MSKVKRGITLIESMLLVVILGIVSLGFGIALQSSAHAPDKVDELMGIHERLVEKMEDLLSLDFATLAANSGLSDTVTVDGATVTRTVSVAQVDADGLNGLDSDFIELTVTMGSQSLKTRVTKP